MAKGQRITDLQRDKIRALRKANARLTMREIGVIVGLSYVSVWNVLNPKPIRAKPAVAAPAPKPAFTPPVTGSGFIKPIPLSRLMAGR